MDILEFLIQSVPEAIFSSIDSIVSCLVLLMQNKKETVSQKASNLL